MGRITQAGSSHQEGDVMHSKEALSQKKLRLRKTTLREVTPDLAQNVLGGSVPFTKTCTYGTCPQQSCAGTECQ